VFKTCLNQFSTRLSISSRARQVRGLFAFATSSAGLNIEWFRWPEQLPLPFGHAYTRNLGCVGHDALDPNRYSAHILLLARRMLMPITTAASFRLSDSGGSRERRNCQRLQECLYDHNYANDMDSRRRRACLSITLQVQVQVQVQVQDIRWQQIELLLLESVLMRPIIIITA